MYTQEVLAVVLQHLMDQNPVPMLFMRTVRLYTCSHLVVCNTIVTIHAHTMLAEFALTLSGDPESRSMPTAGQLCDDNSH